MRYNDKCTMSFTSGADLHIVGQTFYHDVGQISDLSQSGAPNLVM